MAGTSRDLAYFILKCTILPSVFKKRAKNSENMSIPNDASTCTFLQIRYNIEGISHRCGFSEWG